MKAKIELTPNQVVEITALYREMKSKAIVVGKRLIQLEAKLEQHFRDRTITEGILMDLLKQISSARTELRYVHLSTHLKTPSILSKSQIDGYNKLRGYGGADPCSMVPEGHDAKMWRKHNGCR